MTRCGDSTIGSLATALKVASDTVCHVILIGTKNKNLQRPTWLGSNRGGMSHAVRFGEER
jgi:hypothetical protein